MRAPALPVPSLALADLQHAYRSGALTPTALVEALIAATGTANAQGDPAWITRLPVAALRARAAELSRQDPQALPLYGVPFAVKDNIDVADVPTTAACPAFACTPAADAAVVARLLAAGAIVLGKTNLDQFATGLNGTRSPYGAVPNSFDPAYISGGSSSGSASVVARGLASFALGTDTAGSGRVPAGFSNIVGLKPTRGLLSTRGVLPACRTLDCVSIFALTCDDAQAVLAVAQGFDAADAYSRPAPTASAAPGAPASITRVGIPRAPQFFGDDAQAAAFAVAVAQARALGLEVRELDFTPLFEVAALLYDGPWVAERHAAIRAFFDTQPEAIEPSVRAVIAQAARYSATDAFVAQYRLAELQRTVESIWCDVDALLVPTAPCLPTRAALQAQPIALNSQLGLYTNFVNLLNWAALAVPATLRPDGLPFGVTLIAPAFGEPALLALGARWQQTAALPLGATGWPLPAAHVGADAVTAAAAPSSSTPSHAVQLAVVGAHLSGMPLNHQLTTRRARRVAEARTAPCYRLHALAGTVPPKPGLQRVASDGAAIALEVWELDLTAFGSFVAEVPPPLAIGSVELADGRWVKGFVCEPHALAGARDITAYGGWRAFVAAAAAPATPAH
jgi:allophanate hydrolase